MAPWAPAELWLLLLLQLCPARTSPPRSCPPACICTSDLLSCSRQTLQRVPRALPPTATTLDLSHNALSQLQDGWLAALPHLEALHVGHNQIGELSPRAFHNASRLRHLDMSSNRLRAVETHYFEELGLGNFSLRTLDLSSNSLSSLPVEELAALPEHVRNGLYLHNNPVRCSCPLYLMLQRWRQRGFSSVRDFFEEHTCKVSDAVPRSLIKLLKYSHLFENCSAEPDPAQPVPFPVTVGRVLLLGCNASLPHVAYMWISPHHEPIWPPGNANRSVEVFHNGSLRIASARPWHSGIYVCLAINGPRNVSRLCEVNVTVHYSKPDGEAFSTGLTTLLGCIVSLLLVLVYLFVTPCRCPPCCRTAPPSPPQECSAQSSILSATPPTTDGPSRRASKHVAFLEPAREVLDGKERPVPGEGLPDGRHPKVLQLRSDTESISSVFSDTPIVS
ncbi:amphoterin-induced protein 3 isoform X2 [Phasianus colchicus]|uniref:Adhesion molecule with Ig like domain 3 n=1 Tax=Phasianus colchicus TaxID=9054 RepID=A0A669QKP4_PHACC|nr:amphoterin-induced protein 3 isoform X2 [Phasianus colchicus]